jgi:hypothetical protein
MVGFGGAISFRDWLRSWTERLDRLDAYLRRQREGEAHSTESAGQDPDDYRHRRN